MVATLRCTPGMPRLLPPYSPQWLTGRVPAPVPRERSRSAAAACSVPKPPDLIIQPQQLPPLQREPAHSPFFHT